MKLFGFLAVFSSAKDVEFDFVLDQNARAGMNNVNQFTMFYAQMDGMPNFLDFNAKQWQYGCWGQIDGAEARPGHGEALDVIDQLFQDWQKCKECMAIDFEDTCDVDNAAYEVR